MMRTTVTPILSAFLLLLSLSAGGREDRELSPDLTVAVDKFAGKEYTAALAILDSIDSRDSLNDAVKYYKGCISAALNDFEGATRNFRKAYELDSSNYWYKSRMAGILASSGQNAGAIRLYESMLTQQPNDLMTMAALSSLYIEERDFKLADSMLTTLERIQGRSEFTDLVRLDLLRLTGDFTGFFEKLDRYMSVTEMDGEQKCQMLNSIINAATPGFNTYHLKDWSRVIQTCLDSSPGDTAVAHLAISFHYTLGNDNQVLSIGEKFPGDFFAVMACVYSEMRQGNYKSAVGYCDRVWELDDGSHSLELHSLKGDCFQQLGQIGKACREYEAGLRIDPDNLLILNNYAYFMACNGIKLGKCVRMSRKVVEAESENPTYLDTYAYILHRLKKYAEAKTYFKKALLYGGKEHPEILDHYADTLEALGESELAEGYRQQAAMKRNENRK